MGGGKGIGLGALGFRVIEQRGWVLQPSASGGVERLQGGAGVRGLELKRGRI
jgi:hypothetical protein